MKTLAITFTKLVVADLDASERFYCGVFGLIATGRAVAGEGELAQELSPLSLTGEASESRLVLSRFLERPAPPPGAAWIGLLVSDVEATSSAIAKAGGTIVRPPEDQPAYGVRAAIVSDPEGHMIELAQMLGVG